VNKNAKKASKFLSLLLRHKPEVIGLTLDDGGWAKVEDLIRLTESHHTQLSKALILEAVATNEKQRFAISPDGLRIRANQGHSISVALDLDPMVPPEKLFHGTATRFLGDIMSEGLTKQNRQYVHLTDDIDTAKNVGTRHGKVVLLEVNAAEMHAQGFVFYRSENGVWLTEHVPPERLQPYTG